MTSPVLQAGSSPAGRADEGARLHQASQAFEALLMQILLRTMRQAQLEQGFFGGEEAGSSTYESIVETNLADLLSASSPLGIAKQVEERWSKDIDAGREVEQALKTLDRLRAERAYTAPDAALPASTSTPGAPPQVLPASDAQTVEGASSGFGWRRDPLDGGHRFHGGVDLPAPAGTPVLAVAPGRVVSVGRRGGYGLQVLLDHGQGWVTRYAHLSATSVTPGQWIGRRDALGQVGDSGRTTGPHLHFEARRFGRSVDPGAAVPGKLRTQVLPRGVDE